MKRDEVNVKEIVCTHLKDSIKLLTFQTTWPRSKVMKVYVRNSISFVKYHLPKAKLHLSRAMLEAKPWYFFYMHIQMKYILKRD